MFCFFNDRATTEIYNLTLNDDLPISVNTLKNVDLILAEDTRHSSKLISHFQISKKLIAFHDHNEKSQYMKIIEKLKDGLNIALISDAGTPLINDPGFNLVRSAKQENCAGTTDRQSSPKLPGSSPGQSNGCILVAPSIAAGHRQACGVHAASVLPI